MANIPSLAFVKWGRGPQILEFYLDLVCPFSRKMVKSIQANLASPEPTTYAIVIRHHPQPWHASSMLLHEASISFGHIHPQHWWEYFTEVMERQEEFYDIPTSTLTAEQIRDKLAGIAGEVLEKKGIKGPLSKIVGDVRDQLLLKSTPNGGNAVSNDLKYCIKLGRQNGIHVSPTVLFNGLVENSISSSWGAEEWTKFIKEKGL